MKDKAEIGFVCSKGHPQFVGELDYGVCGSKKVANIYVSVEALDNQFGTVLSAEDVAERLEHINRKYDQDLGW